MLFTKISFKSKVNQSLIKALVLLGLFYKEYTMNLLKSSVLIVCFIFSTQSIAEQKKLKYFMVQGKVTPAVAKMLVQNPADPTAGAKKTIESIKGAKLISYYLEAGTAQNIAIIAVPDTEIAAALVYQRMSTGALLDITVREIIPAKHVKSMLETAKEIDSIK